jgi:Spy/CpxP family protein refolding chaperone
VNRPTHNLKSLAMLLLAASMAIASAPTLLAAPHAKAGPKSAQETLQEQQDLILQECKLSDEQQKAIKEKFKLKQEALETWEKANAEKLKAAEDAAKTARQGADASAKKNASSALKELETNRTQATAEADKAILAVLSEEQQSVWAGVQLAQKTLPRYKKANLSDEQTAKVKSACLIAAKDLAEFAGDDKKAKQGRTTVEKSLKWAIDNVILTAEQRETAVRKPASKK